MTTNRMMEGEPLIRVQHLGKKFVSMEVLKDISVDIYKGDKLVLINKSHTSYDHLAKVAINDSIGKVLKSVVEQL